jgi:hypothetical protein
LHSQENISIEQLQKNKSIALYDFDCLIVNAMYVGGPLLFNCCDGAGSGVSAMYVVGNSIKVFDVFRLWKVGFEKMRLGSVDVIASEIECVVYGFILVHMPDNIFQFISCDVFIFDEAFDLFF